MKNGLLLAKAEEFSFAVLITADRSMSYQQKISGRNLGLLVLNTGDWRPVKPCMPAITEALNLCAPGTVTYVEI